MKISIGNDHKGYDLKEKIKIFLMNNSYEVIDKGTDSTISVDYPQFAKSVGKSVVSSESDFGIVICDSGIGVSIACNKVKGARCAKITSVEEAIATRSHNDANVLALSGQLEERKALEIVEAFIKTDFSKEERHIRRIGLIEDEY